MSATRNFGLSVNDHYRLEAACERIQRVWGGFNLYLVGTATTTPSYRDVDVRLIMSDKRYKRLGSPAEILMLNAAMSDWLGALSSLPIDFQFQSMTEANQYDGKRHPLGHAPTIAEDN